MMEDARRRIRQWLEAAPGVLDSMSRLLDQHERLRDAERECARLRQELAAARAENDRRVKEWREIDDLIAGSLGKANDALLRLRACLAAPAPAAAPVPPAAAPLVAPAAAPTSIATAASPREEPVAPNPRRILLVDDDADFRTMIVHYLADRGYEVLAAGSGEEALALLPRFQPHAVLLDLAMPGGGMWAIERIKTRHPDLCVIVVTANDDPSIAQKARALGAADYVTKPFDLDYLDAVLDIHLTRGNGVPLPRPVPAAMVAADGGAPLPTTVRPIRSCFARR